MNALDQILAADWITRLGWTLLHSLWEIALVAAVLALVLSSLRHGSANVRYLASCGGLAVMAILPIVTFGILPDYQAPDAMASAPVEQETPKEIAAVPVENTTTAAIGMEDRGVSVLEHTGAHRPVVSPPVTVVAPAALRPTADVLATNKSQQSSLQRIARVLSPWMPWCVVSWFVGVFVVSVWNLGGWIAAQRLKRLGTSPVAEDISRRLSTLGKHSGINRVVVVMKSLMVEVPVVVGWLRPTILLPAVILTGLTPAELDAVLAHELAHIRRHDYLVNLVQTVIETLFFYHPGVWWLSRQIRTEREHCCDDAAIAVCGNKVDYASALAAVEAGRAVPKMVMAARKTDSGTLGRIRRVLGLAGNAPRRWGRSLAGGLVTSAMVVALVTCFVVAGDGTKDNVSRAETVSAGPAEENDRIAELIEQLSDDDRTWTAAVIALQKLGEPAVVELVEALEDKNPRVRRGAVQALGEIKVASVIDPLIKMLNDSETAIRIDAANGLGSLASYDTKNLRPARLVPALAAVMKDKDDQVRSAATWSLWQSNDPRAVQPLLGALSDEHPSVRWRAAEGLGFLRAKAAVEPLTAALQSDDEALRSHAADALGRIGDRRPLPQLSALASNDEDAGVRASAGEALRLIQYPQRQLGPTVWGEPVDGLQAGLRCTSDMAPYRYGEIVHYQLLVRNTTDKLVKLEWVANGWSPMVQGNRVELLGMCNINGTIHTMHSTIPPHGEVSTHTFQYAVRPPDWEKRDSLQWLGVAAGAYEVSATFHSYPHDPKAKDVWKGRLPTGDLSLTVVTEEVVGETEDNASRTETALEVPDGNSSVAQPEKLQWGSELDGFKVRAEIEEGLWTEGKSSPLVSAFVNYRGPEATTADYLHDWLIEIDGTRYRLMLVSWGRRSDVNLTADRSFGIGDHTHTVSLRFASANDGERVEVQRIENGSVINMYGLSTVDEEYLRGVANPPELVPGKHTLRIGFPVGMTYRSIGLGAIRLPDTGDDGVQTKRESDGWAMSNPVEIEIFPPDAAGSKVEGDESIERTEDDTARKPSIGIYLVTGRSKDAPAEKTRLADFTLADDPLISEEDIFQYDWQSHTIRLKQQAVADRILNRKTGSFVVVVNGERLYDGAMRSMLSSHVPATPVIHVGPTAEQFQPRMAVRIHAPPIEGMPDPRRDNRLYRALQASGKLIDKGITVRLRSGECRDGQQWMSFDL